MSETISPSFTFVKAGIFYFSRRIPTELKSHYTSPRIAFSLRTRSARIAEARARRAADQLDEYWFHLLSQSKELPGKHMLRLQRDPRAASKATPVPQVEAASETITLSESMALYLKHKGNNRPDTFHRAAERASGYVIDACGDKPLDAYTRADANAFRDSLIKRGLAGSSMTRVFGTVRSIINFAASEQGITMKNPFAGVYYDRDAGVSDRQAVPMPALRKLQQECRNLDDDLRWLVALVSDTGMRLAEAAGMTLADFQRDGNGALVAHVRPHPWRRLKTKRSERIVPLEGEALWAAERILSQGGGSKFAFPRYNKAKTTNANAASAALNKWMKTNGGEDTTMHGFRHAMRDRLRAVECPADIVDQSGGWQTEGVGHGYGSGYPAEVLRKWIKAATRADMVYGSKKLREA